MENIRTTVNWLVSLVLIGAYASIGLYTDAGGSLSVPYLAVFFLLVYLLMYGADQTNSLVELVTDPIPISVGTNGAQTREDGGADTEDEQ